MTLRSGARKVDDSEGMDHAVRLGLVAYGVVHLIVAFTAFDLAFGTDKEATASQQGAFAQLARSPLGAGALYVVALGFAALVVWQGLEAWRGYRHEDGAKRAFKRAASAGKAVVYAVLGYSAAAMAAGSSGSSGGERTSDNYTARLMAAPGGQAMVGLLGLTIAGIGVYLGYRGIAEKFTKRLDAEATSGSRRTPIVTLGKVGYLGKGATFVAVGALFVTAAMRHDPSESGGLDVALQELARQPFGPYMLAAVAVALGCFGVFCLAWARHLDR